MRLNISTMEFLSTVLNNIPNATFTPRCHSILAEVKVEQWLAIFEEKNYNIVVQCSAVARAQLNVIVGKERQL